ncbi:DUF397 domain-containing protein [Streptomyces griseoluteus]|uniref:DUF397 domain-containing protein n=1 Tax=Streptomyces griseoluteus TaxID=29306 RepID=UPI0036AAF89F
MQYNTAALVFVTSSHSLKNACVEAAVTTDGGRAVRDSKDKSGPIRRYTAKEGSALLAGVKAGELDL